jgi:outer membrane receptor protein involved in Fe transport
MPEENLYNDDIIIPGLAFVNEGGNPDLLAEDASTFSIGAVWTPYFLDGLSVSIDFFDVEIENYIERTPFSVPDLVAACYGSDSEFGGPGTAACNSFVRDSRGQRITTFTGFRNLGLHEVSGWDFNIEYGLDFLTGYLDINYFATKINERRIKDDTFGEVDLACSGAFNGDCDNLIDYPVFEFKHRMTAAWSKNNWDLQLVWKYNSSLKDGNDEREYFREKIDSYSIVDLSGRYNFGDHWIFTTGVKNLLDKKPQAIGSNSWEYSQTDIPSISNTYAQYYDVFGRTWFVKASYNL